MKREVKLLVPVLFTALTAFQCNDDDKKREIPEQDLLSGKWAYYQEWNTFDGMEYDVEDYENDCAGKKDYMEFLQDGNIRDISHYQENNCQPEDQASYYDKVTWKKESDKITFTYEDGGHRESVTVAILQLDNETLKIKHNDGFSDYDIVKVLKRM